MTLEHKTQLLTKRRANERPVISVGLPLLNSARTIGQAVTSILNQTFSEWELIALDDGSQDDTVDIIRSFADPRIRVIAEGRHLGLAAQLNRAVKMSRGRYFARMDADDLAYPTRLEKQFVYLEAHLEVDLLATSVLVFQKNGIALGIRRQPAEHESLCHRAWCGIRMQHPTWMGRIDWFRCNPYRTDAYRMEDRELLFRTHRFSRFATLPDILLGYREEELHLGKILFARKNTCQAMLRHAREHRAYLESAFSVSAELLKSIVDAVAITSGLGYRVLRHRAQPMTMTERAEWEQVWQQTLVAAQPWCSDRAPEQTAVLVDD